MAQIQEYLPQQEAQGAVGGTSPNLEIAGAVGRGIERVGGAIEEGADLIHRRQAQEETADIYANFADKRAFYTQQIDQQTRDGSLNVDSLKDQINNDPDLQKLSDGMSTPEGRNYFTRQQSRLSGHLIQMANAGQAQVAANAAKGSFKMGMDKTSVAIFNKPDSFQDSYEAGLEHIDQLIKTGSLPEKMRDQAVQELGTTYAQAAIRGAAKLDPEKAKQLLDKGAFDQVGITGAVKSQMYGEVQMASHAREVEEDRVERAVERAQKAHFNSIMNGSNGQPGWYDKIKDGTLDTDSVMGAKGIGWQQKNLALEMINRANEEKYKGSPGDFNEAYLRIKDSSRTDMITDDQQLIQAYPNMPAHMLKSLSGEIVRSPEGMARAAKEKELHAEGQSLLFVDPQNGRNAPESKAILQRYLTDYAVEKGKYLKAGKDPDELLDRTSPNWWGYKIGNYQVKPEEQMQYLAKQRQDRALGTNVPPGQTVPPTAAGQQPPAVTDQGPAATPDNPAAAAPAQPQAPPAKELNWWEPHPGDSPEMAKTRAMNAADREAVMGALQSLSKSPITKGIMENFGATKQLIGGLQKGKPSDNQKLLGDRAVRPGESIEEYNARLKINVGPMGPIK